jgi:hypothetical protein
VRAPQASAEVAKQARRSDRLRITTPEEHRWGRPCPRSGV